MRPSNLVNDPIVIYAFLLIHKIDTSTYYTLHLNEADLMDSVKSMILANLNHQPQKKYKIQLLERVHEALDDTNDFTIIAAVWDAYTRGEEKFEKTTVSLPIS